MRANGRLYAYQNECPHQGGPVCEGLLIHRVEEDIGPDKTYRGMRYTDDLQIVCLLKLDKGTTTSALMQR